MVNCEAEEDFSKLSETDGSVVKKLPADAEVQETQVQSLGQEDPLEEEMATYSSILAWKIPWTGAWWATVDGVTKSQTVTEHACKLSEKMKMFFYSIEIGLQKVYWMKRQSKVMQPENIGKRVAWRCVNLIRVN